ncbi:MAG: hypothetical protein ACK5LX_04005 [Oscillospiraceae bacterium]
MELVMQPNPCACGQACIAMLTDKPIAEVIDLMNTDGPTSIGQLISALDHCGVKHAEKNLRISKKNPEPANCSILTVHMPTYTHWVVYRDGKYYDPEFGLLSSCHPEGRITSFLAVYP